MLKKATVVILPQKATLITELGTRSGKLYSINGLALPKPKTLEHHLYFTTEEEIKVNDWVIIKGEHLRQVSRIDNDKYLLVGTDNAVFQSVCKKIVATTNEELWSKTRMPETEGTFLNKPLPKIGLDFVEAFVKKQGNISEVMLEYEYDTYQAVDVSESFCEPFDDKFKTFYKLDAEKLKLRSNGSVIIHPVKERVYSRKEVRELLDEFYTAFGNMGILHIENRINTWFEKNYPE